jgi:hypothetical protein
LRQVTERERRTEAVPGVKVADLAAEHGEVNIKDRGHHLPAMGIDQGNDASATLIQPDLGYDGGHPIGISWPPR